MVDLSPASVKWMNAFDFEALTLSLTPTAYEKFSDSEDVVRSGCRSMSVFSRGPESPRQEPALSSRLPHPKVISRVLCLVFPRSLAPAIFPHATAVVLHKDGEQHLSTLFPKLSQVIHTKHYYWNRCHGAYVHCIRMYVNQPWSKTAKVGGGGGTGVRSPPREGEGEITGEES